MTFQLLDSLSLPGDSAKANEDAFGHGEGAAVVIDGATPLGDGLMPGPSDAAWIAQFGARRLMAHLRDGDGARKALRATLGDAQKSFEALRRHPPEEMWQTPCASMMLVVPDKEGLEFLWFGDCAALVARSAGDAAVTIVGETFDKRAAEADRARALAKEKNLSPAAGLSRPEFIGTLRAARNRINSGDRWLFSPDVKAAAHVARRVIKLAPGSTLLLATDGFLALASDYGAYSADSLMAAALSKGLAALGAELRAIEAGDGGGDKFPRFKKSDDATALLLQKT
jgi:serine/threonine protein phosphatase PrpC